MIQSSNGKLNDLPSVIKPCKILNSCNSGIVINKGASILRNLRYKTGKLHTNISCAVNEKISSLEKPVNQVQILDPTESDEIQSCDDPQHEVEKFLPVAVPKTSQNRKLKGFSCTVCGHTASSSERLKEHLSRHSGVKHLECDICGKKFAWRYSFKNHMVSHLENNPNTCTICGKKYCNKSSMKNHILRVHGNPNKTFMCEKCNKTFFTKTELDSHIYNHSKQKPFVCEYCGNSYRFKGSLIVHHKIHSGEKPYKCGYCDKEFLHLSSVIGHRRRHTGEKPFQCNECGKSFSVKRSMTSHMYVHSKIGKFKCSQCEKCFKSRSGFRAHLDLHIGIKRHACEYCGKAFRAWCNMHKHIQKHLSAKALKCKLCDKTFIGKLEFKNHMKCHNEIKNGEKQEKINVNHNIINADISAPILNSSCNIESTIFGNTAQTDIIPHIDIAENQVMFDCNMSNAIDKCSMDKCMLIQDNYASQFLYPQYPPVQYVTQPVNVQNMYSSETEQNPQRSACLSNINSPNFNCAQLNNPSFNSFSYNLPNSDELLFKCKLCRNLFHSTLILRSHLLEYHRIDEDNVDELLA